MLSQKEYIRLLECYEESTNFYVVFFGDRPCYAVHNPTKEFYKDLKDRNLAILSESKERY